tara:strand:- start:368 stop:910 length:543 start_codon:yes stop_codon:yes gene_type:complete
LTKNVENINEICRRYANALILSSTEENDLKKISQNFEHFNEVLKTSNDLSKYIKNPLINSQKKSLVLKKICKSFSYNQFFQGFISVLTKHGKINLQEKIYNEYKRIIDFRAGLTEIIVTTSEPLNKDVEQKLKKKLSESLKLKIKLKKIIDKDIIGGIIIKIKSVMIDNSIKSKLTEFEI